MNVSVTERWWTKWDKAARTFDRLNGGLERRFGDAKREWFSRAAGRTLLAAVGTGLDLPYLPVGLDLTGIDISSEMLEKARLKVQGKFANVGLVRADIGQLGFPDDVFDTVVTSCTFCSVPDPVSGLRELLRVLKPRGRLLMFEHVRSDIFWMGPMMDLMTLLSRRFGPDLNRKTRDNVLRSGFKLVREVNLYLDMVKLFEAEKPESG